MTEIGECAFARCSSLSQVNLPKGLTRLRGGAFWEDDLIASVTVPKALERCDTLAGSDSYYDGSVEHEGWIGPFAGCDGLKSVAFEEGATRVPAEMFSSCCGIESVSIPDSVTSIDEAAFQQCINLESITLPDKLQIIGDNAFAESGLLSVTIPNSVTDMGCYIFQDCTSLKSATLPNIRVNITEGTFAGCTSLEAFTCPSTVEAIRRKAFDGCTALKEFKFSDKVTIIESNAFENCSALKAVTIPESVVKMGDNVYYDCDALMTVTIADSVTSLGERAFYDCDALTSVNLGSGLTEIEESAFEDCDSLASFSIPRRVKTVGSNAFKNDTKLTSLTVPRSVTSIADNAFSYPAKMTIYGISGTYAETYAKAKGAKFVNKEVAATSVSLSSTEVSLYTGMTTQLKLSVAPSDFTDTVTWKSGNTGVFTVDDTGTIEAVSAGTATLKVTVGSKSASCKVTVLQGVTYVGISDWNVELEAFESRQLEYSVYPSNATNKQLNWTSSDTSVATVDSSGKVTAVAKGEAKITATSAQNPEESDYVTVIVTSNGHIATKASELESSHPYAEDSVDFWQYTSAGAKSLDVTFDSQTNIEDGFDYLYIYTGDGTQIGKYTGIELAGKTITVEGDTVRIKLDSDDSGTEWGFKVTSVKVNTETLTKIAVPTAKTGLTYTGKAQTGVAAGTGYTLSGTTSATNAGTYTATATLKEGYCWTDGTKTAKTITWSISRKAVAVPAAKVLTYTGKAQTGVAAGTGYTVKNGSATNVGTYVATVTPGSNYRWTDGTTATKAVKFTIAKAAQSVKVSAAKRTANYSPSKAQTLAATAVTGAKTTVTWTMAKKAGFSINAKTGKITVAKGVKAGTYKLAVTATAVASSNYKAASSAATVTVTVSQATQTAKSASTTKSFSAAKSGTYKGKLAKAKAFTAKLAGVKDSAKVTYSLKSVTKAAKSYVTVSSAGKVTVKKGLAKGTYTLKVKAAIAKTTNYKAKTVYLTYKITVK